MSDTNALTQLPSAASHAKDIGQITAIEQARAVAEVQARVIVAQGNPRNIQEAIAEMEVVCRQKLLADRAFYNVPRAGSMITGVSIDLAKELARCWRNVDYEVAELRRDDEKGHSEMSAWAWDMQANNKATIKFQVPHTRDMKTGSKRMNDINEIYNLLANMGSRRVREQILKILPTWFVERAKELCYKTIEDGGGVPLPQRIAAAIKVFAELGVTTDRLERRFGAKTSQWTPHHLAQLQVTHTSLHQGMTTVEQEFPVEVITREQLPDVPAPVVSPTPQQEPDPSSDAADYALLRRLQEQLSTLEYKNPLTFEELDDIRVLAGRDLTGLHDLTNDELAGITDELAGILQADHPGHALDALLDHLRTEGRE